MALPINIHELLTGQVIEWDRLEFKEGWNPLAIGKTICAFANDINNWGGGYVIIGVKESAGSPQFPPIGLEKEKLDYIQKELLELCHRISPHYYPVSAPVEFMGKLILVIWAPGGDNRPYRAPVGLGKSAGYEYYVRRGSSTVVAKGDVERKLMELAAKVPFDDRINSAATIEDLSLPLIRSFLKRIGSDLLIGSEKIPFLDLCRQLRIVRGPDEFVRPTNAGLLFFSLNPERFFKGAQIEIVQHHDHSGSNITEKIITGSLDTQIEESLQYLKNVAILEEAQKQDQYIETKRFFNFPINALKELIANAVYHKSYELQNPIEIQIWPDKIEILNFPGPLAPVTKKSLELGRIVARDYRNRVVGDFLKELRYTEGRGTGIPKVRTILLENGSPAPVLETDEESTYFLATIPIHPFFKQVAFDQAQGAALSPRELGLLSFCRVPRRRKEILESIGLQNHSSNFERNVVPLIMRGLLIRTHPDHPTSSQQRYYTNPSGLKFVDRLLGNKADNENDYV